MLASCTPPPPAGPIILAPASLQTVLDDLARRWTKDGRAVPVISYSATATAARQVGEGAPADIVLTADVRWMGWLAERGLLAGPPRDLARGRLVVVAPADTPTPSSLAAFLTGGDARLAIGDPDQSPAGAYAMEALRASGQLALAEDRIVRSENVRAALALVERGEAGLGIVYASDAVASRRVRVIEPIDASLHQPILFQAAIVRHSGHPDAGEFLAHLLSPAAADSLVQYGFDAP